MQIKARPTIEYISSPEDRLAVRSIAADSHPAIGQRLFPILTSEHAMAITPILNTIRRAESVLVKGMASL